MKQVEREDIEGEVIHAILADPETYHELIYDFVAKGIDDWDDEELFDFIGRCSACRMTIANCICQRID